MAPKRSTVWEPSGSLVDGKDAQASERKRQRKQLQRRGTDEQVDRCLGEHFKGWSSLETHGSIIDGMTLAERIKADKRMARETSSRLGSSYWVELRAKYSASATWAAELKVADSSQPVSAVLIEGLRHAANPNVTKRTKAPLLNYLATTASMNQKELCGLIRHIMQVRPGSSPSATSLVVEVMKAIVRLDLVTTCQQTVAVGRTLFDEALCAAYAMTKREGIPTSQFWEVYSGVAGLLMDTEDVATVLAEQESFLTVATEIKRIVAGSQLGSKMFGVAANELTAEEFSQSVETALDKLPQTGITMQHYTAFMAALSQRVSDMAAMRTNYVHRTISVKYRGLSLEIEVTSSEHEVALRAAARLKSLAAGGHLPLLPMEEELLPPVDAATAEQAVAIEVVREWRLARLACKDLLSQQAATAELCKELMLSKKVLHTQMDKSWDIELVVAHTLAAQGGETAMQEKILAALPTASEGKTVEHALSDLEVLGATTFYSFSCKAAQAKADMTREILVDVSRGKEPRMSQVNSTPFMREVGNRLQFFVRHIMPSGSSGISSVLTGKDALEHKLSVLEAEIAEQNREATLAEVDEFHVFAYLLDASARERVSKMTENAVVAVATSGGAAPKRRATRAAADAGGKNKSAKQARVKQESKVLELFT